MTAKQNKYKGYTHGDNTDPSLRREWLKENRREETDARDAAVNKAANATGVKNRNSEFAAQARAGRQAEAKKYNDPPGISGAARLREDNRRKLLAYKNSLLRAQAKGKN